MACIGVAENRSSLQFRISKVCKTCRLFFRTYPWAHLQRIRREKFPTPICFALAKRNNLICHIYKGKRPLNFMTLTKFLDISAKLRNFCLFSLICTIFVSKLLNNFVFHFWTAVKTRFAGIYRQTCRNGKSLKIMKQHAQPALAQKLETSQEVNFKGRFTWVITNLSAWTLTANFSHSLRNFYFHTAR